MCACDVQLKVSMFDASTLVRDEVGEDYTLKVISDVDDDNMVIVRTQYITQSVFIPGIFEMGGGNFPPKKLTIPQTAAKLCALFFSAGKMNYKYIRYTTETFF